MKYSVCASALFMGQPLPQSLAGVKASGASAYEFWTWWDQDLDALEAAQREAGLVCATLCTKFVPLTDPARRDEYIEGLKGSIAVAHRLGSKSLISQVGPDMPGMTRQQQHDSIVAGLKICAPMLEKEGVTLVVEPLNTLVDHKGYYLYSSAEGFDIVREVGSPNVKLLFDIYHQQIMEGNLIANITAGVEMIGHVHVAGNPGRHEPTVDSEVNYPVVLRALEKAGYEGYVGLEYFPKQEPVQSLRETLKVLP